MIFAWIYIDISPRVCSSVWILRVSESLDLIADGVQSWIPSVSPSENSCLEGKERNYLESTIRGLHSRLERRSRNSAELRTRLRAMEFRSIMKEFMQYFSAATFTRPRSNIQNYSFREDKQEARSAVGVSLRATAVVVWVNLQMDRPSGEFRLQS